MKTLAAIQNLSLMTLGVLSLSLEASIVLDPTMISSAADALQIDERLIESTESNVLEMPSVKVETHNKVYEIVLVPQKEETLRPDWVPDHWIQGRWKPQTQRTFKWYEKINPIFWFGNADDPEPPEDYRPQDKLRKLKWYFRNPAHNFTFYVIGVSDKVGSADHESYGLSPNEVFNSHSKWNLIVHRVRVAGSRTISLPFVSYRDDRVKIYFGWRQSGNFGIKLTKNKKPN